MARALLDDDYTLEPLENLEPLELLDFLESLVADSKHADALSMGNPF